MARTSPAKEEIVAFLKSGEPGFTSDLSVTSLKKAAQDLFTANGLNCPVAFASVHGQTLMINREKFSNGHGNH